MGECVGVLAGELGGNSFSWCPRDGFPIRRAAGRLVERRGMCTHSWEAGQGTQ